ncbi:MAG: hypothetical protein KGL25_03980 [Gammaproteobacteria bacterium]|nr:hypothetical protein [Gammaproteobacteria bacterium]MDE2250547.1 hypothetical protein [Gammaproteobacteria bacterium]
MEPERAQRPNPRRRWRLPALRALAWTALSAGFASLGAADSGTLLPVSANVRPVAHLEAALPAQLLISGADLARGFVDMPRALRVQVYSNSRAGFVLDVAAQSPWFTAVTIDGLDSPVTLGVEGGTIVQRWHGANSRALGLRMCFKLAPGLLPGLYAWPLQLRARPLP